MGNFLRESGFLCGKDMKRQTDMHMTSYQGIIRYLAIIILFLACAGIRNAVAQEYESTPVTVSKEKVRMNGIMYYSHIVLERQTLFSISKAYDVSIDDIYKANPSLKETGLKKNSIILIPAVDKNTVAPNTQNADVKEEEAVRKDTGSNMPEVRDSDRKKVKKQKEEEAEYRIHTVKWYEDLDVISEKYGVSVESIMRLNNLTGRKLTKKQKLKIPYSEIVASEPEKPEIKKDSIPVPVREEAGRQEATPAKLFPKNKVNVTLMLPLNASGTGGSSNNFDFYSGVLMAVNDMGNSGINIDLSVYDVAGGSLHVTEERLKASDLVIGPVSSGDISRLLEVAPSNTNIISPLDHRVEALVSGHENLTQVPASYATQYDDLISWISEDRKPEDRVITILEKGARETAEMKTLTERLGNSGLQHSSLSYSILEGRDILYSLEKMMNLNSTNRVLIASESEAFVNDVVRNLNLLIHKKYDIVLYAPSRIRSFETIEIDNFHKTRMHVSLSYHIDYNDAKVKDFLMKYRALFNTEPTPFAFQGYDVACYFIRKYHEYGKDWQKSIENMREHMLQSDFRFERKCNDGSSCGLINTAVKRIVYNPDYTITEIKTE